MTNSVDPDQTARSDSEQSDLGVHCLLRHFVPISHVTMATTISNISLLQVFHQSCDQPPAVIFDSSLLSFIFFYSTKGQE